MAYSWTDLFLPNIMWGQEVGAGAGYLIGGTPTPQRVQQARLLLAGTAIGLAAIIGGEAVYGSLLKKKRRKAQKNAPQGPTSTSTPTDRGTSAILAVLSNKTVMAPLSYLYVQAAEDAGIIPGAYGDAYQAVLSAMVGADLASSIGKVVPL